MVRKTNDMVIIAKKIGELQKRGRSRCKRCGGQHGIGINLPTRKSQFCKGAIDLGLFITVPCHTCHPGYFKRYMRAFVKTRPDVVFNESTEL